MAVVAAASKTPRHCCNLDGECPRHRAYYCAVCDQCPKCHPVQEDNMSRTAKAKAGDNVCDYCDQPSTVTTRVRLEDGGTMMVCQGCVRAVEQSGSPPANAALLRVSDATPDTKVCGCEYDGETPTYCPEHDRHYCSNCTAGRGECPVCDIYDAAVYDKRELDHCEHTLTSVPARCQDHGVWYCSRCHPICPRCQIDAVEASVEEGKKAALPARLDINPSNYPLVSCYTHGWYCSRCDKNCPSCNHRGRWEMTKCVRHPGKHYCPRCGLGCSECGKRPPLAADDAKEQVMECPACRKKECRYCEDHKNWFCSACDGNCLRCDGCYTKGGSMFHKCGKQMSFCHTHKKHFCLQCGQKCTICVSAKKHRCGKPMAVCKRHDRTYCPNCNADCDDCKKEAEVARSKPKHHCGCSMLFCAKHQLHFCPACDYLCNCSINCGVVEKYGSKEDEKRFAKLTEDVEWQWADFQNWIKERDSLNDAFKDFYENWHDLMRFLYPKLLLCGADPMAEETGEKLMAVDDCFKGLYRVALTLGMKDKEDEDEGWADIDEADVDEALDRAYGGMASYRDSDGRVHHFYRDDDRYERQHKPHHVKVAITDEGDDLSVGGKRTSFQSIVIEKK